MTDYNADLSASWSQAAGRGHRSLIVVFSRDGRQGLSTIIHISCRTKNSITRFWGVMFPILDFIHNFLNKGREGRAQGTALSRGERVAGAGPAEVIVFGIHEWFGNVWI